MARIVLYSVLVLGLTVAQTAAEEKKATEETKATKVETTKVEVTKTEATKEVKPTKPTQPQLDKDGLYQIEKNIIDFTNSERVRRGLKPLAIDKTLVQSARGHAQWMTKAQRLQHTGKAVGENIAMGYNTSRDVVRGWMNSSGHRANILNSGYRRIGVAAYQSKNGTVWWCQQFMR